MKRYTAAALLLLFSCHGSFISYNKDGFRGSFYQSAEKMQQHHGPAAAWYNFKPGDKVASIGAQTCVNEAIYACFSDSVEFYLEDIDTTWLNAAQAAYVWDYYGKLRGRALTCSYKLTIGTPSATMLPENYFDKCLVINSFHEFTEPKAMLADLYSKLKPGGILYIDEQVPQKTGQLHGICRMRLYTAPELEALTAPAGFTAVGSLVLNWRRGLPARVVYAWQKPA